MKAAVLAAFAASIARMWLNNDGTDYLMPDVIKNAAQTVEVSIRYSPSTDACFPDCFAKVRFIDGKVMLADLALYPEMPAKPAATHIVLDASEGLVAFFKDEAWGACDTKGKVILAPQFESPPGFYGGLSLACQGGKYGFIDKSGRWVIQPTFDSDTYIGNFVGNACPVSIGGKRAVINKKGDFLWKPGLVEAEIKPGGGVFVSTIDGRSGYLDNSGALIPGGKPNPKFK